MSTEEMISWSTLASTGRCSRRNTSAMSSSMAVRVRIALACQASFPGVARVMALLSPLVARPVFPDLAFLLPLASQHSLPVCPLQGTNQQVGQSQHICWRRLDTQCQGRPFPPTSQAVALIVAPASPNSLFFLSYMGVSLFRGPPFFGGSPSLLMCL